MPKKDYIKIYESMLKNELDQRKILKRNYKYYKGSCSIYTLKFYESQINECNKHIKALKNSINNQKAIDNLYNYLYT